jgi:hypothetical protein
VIEMMKIVKMKEGNGIVYMAKNKRKSNDDTLKKRKSFWR